MPQPRRSKKVQAVVAALLVVTPTFEGTRLLAYRDPVGIPTICAGATKGVRMGQRATPEECSARTMVDLYEHLDGMAKCVRVEDMPDKVMAAFLDFTYNVGVGKFCGSTAAKLIQRGDYTAACNELPKWTKAKKAGVMITLPGLVTRRAWEQKECLSYTRLADFRRDQ